MPFAIGTPFIPGWNDLRPFLAECWIIVTIVAVLLTPFFTPRKSNAACAAVTFVGLAIALAAMLSAGGGAGADASAPHFAGMMVADPFAVLWKAMLLVFVMGVVLLWFSATAGTMHEGDGPEFFVLLLGATLGMAVMAGTSNLLMLFMAVELASLPSYVLAGFRKTHRLGAEASLKYVLFGAATSAIMVYGLSMLYGLYGTLQVETLAAKMATGAGGSGALLAVAVFGIIVGLGFKISAVPFHFWCPDVFEGASIDVSAFLSVASKGAALCLLLRVLMLVADALGYQSSAGISLTALSIAVGVLGAVTATVGNTAAFAQTNIKRLLAYSSIAHAGYMLCALSLLVNAGSRQTTAGVNAPAQALLLYLAVYLFMNLGAFTVAALVWRQTGSEEIADYAGLGRRSPVLAACLFCCLISLVGLPPFAGFVAKLNVMYVLADNGGGWWWLVGVIGLNTVFSLFYYVRVIRVMYLTNDDRPAFTGHPLGTALGVVSAAVLVLLLIGFDPLTRLTRGYSHLQGVGDAARHVAREADAATPAPPLADGRQ